ncbi:MAG: hypothetical protein AB8B69_14450 [Chitinophagales bacterium]
MKNWLILIITLCTVPFFNHLEAGHAKITLVSTTTSGEINEDPSGFKTRIHLDSFRAFSKDDCEKEITLKGTIEIVDILEPWQKTQTQPNNRRKFKSKASGTPRNLQKTFDEKGSDIPYRRFAIEPTVGNMTTFNSTLTDKAGMWEFHNAFYIVFKLQDIDRCDRSGSDFIDVNPEADAYTSLKLHVDINKNEIRVVKEDGTLGGVVSTINSYFTVQGNDNLSNVELGGLKLKVSRTKPIGSINTLKGNGG